MKCVDTDSIKVVIDKIVKAEVCLWLSFLIMSGFNSLFLHRYLCA